MGKEKGEELFTIVDDLKEIEGVSIIRFYAVSSMSTMSYSYMKASKKLDPYKLDSMVKGVRKLLSMLTGAIDDDNLDRHAEELIENFNKPFMTRAVKNNNIEALRKTRDEVTGIYERIKKLALEHPLPTSNNIEIDKGALDAISPLFANVDGIKKEMQKDPEVDIQGDLKIRIKNFLNSTVKEIIERNDVGS